MKRILFSLFCLVLCSAVNANAHSVWINNFFSDAHFPPHALVSIGWGHAMPMDDIPNSSNGGILLDRFEVVDPDMRTVQLQKPSSEESKAILTKADFDVYLGDLAVQKIAMKKDSKQGVYQFSAVSKPTFYTQYLDKKGRQRLALKPRNQVKGIDKVLMSVKFQAFAKSYMTLGKWTKPAALGHGLEIIPMTDLSDVRVGDLIEVEILFNGKPVTCSAKSINYITAHSPCFGQSEGFSLMSNVMEGKAQFRVQGSGQWQIGINIKEDVTKNGPMKDLYGKADQVYNAASLTFIVK
jgi:uncharacterized GH25 family protein